MKALIVADDQKIIDEISAVVKKSGYDIILYRWLLKALDNIEEISPDVVIINAAEYPRHWKTLAQYCRSGIPSQPPRIFIAVNDHFSDSEYDKAKKLKVQIFSSAEETLSTSLAELFEQQNPDSLLFTNPVSGIIITGRLTCRDNNLFFSADIQKQIQNIDAGTILNHCTVKKNGKIFYTTAVVVANKETMELKLQED
jgi:hypothetical protein